ncbi:MAG: penicillin-binding transpeptidase domain-containing protein [Polyangiaceae bacterium]|nr:penicillin-binding transpeptidase domain-containing protein [Polyangiaceae bacterium]
MSELLTPQVEAAPGRVSLDLRRAHLARGKYVAPTRDGEPKRLTLDPRLQASAEKILKRARPHEGAIVLSDVRTGKILAWASRGPQDAVATPMAPSASVFKVVTAAALLESQKVSPMTRQCYSGGEHGIEQEDLYDDRSRDDRCTTLGDALGHSVNLVFARMALKHLTPEDLRETAEQLGIGEEIPINIQVPRSQLRIPEDELGFARAAAGFWNGKMSALSALFLMHTVANRGERVPLSILEEDGPPSDRALGRALRISTANTLIRMLEVTTRRGTSAKVFHDENGRKVFPGMHVAGKTGTLIGGKPTRMFSWFAGFAPSRSPRVAISVMLANDVKWWTKGNMVAREMLEAYFEHEKSRH